METQDFFQEIIINILVSSFASFEYVWYEAIINIILPYYFIYLTINQLFNHSPIAYWSYLNVYNKIISKYVSYKNADVCYINKYAVGGGGGVGVGGGGLIHGS